MKVDVTRQASINFRCGSSGSGKSWSVKRDIKKARRLIVFDPDGEYDEFPTMKTVTSGRQLLAILNKHHKSALKVRFCANGKEAFSLWAKAVFAWGNCTAVAEEIAGVTTPQKAPLGWHTLISRGRKRGVVLYAITQRPAECDKTILGNATTIRTGRLARAADRRYLAGELDVNVLHIADLENLDFIERDLMKNISHKGRVGTRKYQKINQNK